MVYYAWRFDLTLDTNLRKWASVVHLLHYTYVQLILHLIRLVEAILYHSRVHNVTTRHF